MCSCGRGIGAPLSRAEQLCARLGLGAVGAEEGQEPGGLWRAAGTDVAEQHGIARRRRAGQVRQLDEQQREVVGHVEDPERPRGHPVDDHDLAGLDGQVLNPEIAVAVEDHPLGGACLQHPRRAREECAGEALEAPAAVRRQQGQQPFQVAVDAPGVVDALGMADRVGVEEREPAPGGGGAVGAQRVDGGSEGSRDPRSVARHRGPDIRTKRRRGAGSPHAPAAPALHRAGRVGAHRRAGPRAPVCSQTRRALTPTRRRGRRAR